MKRVIPPLDHCCDKRQPRQFPHIHVKRPILERGSWNNNRPIKDSCPTIKQEPLLKNPVQQTFQKHCLAGAPAITSSALCLGNNGFIIQPTNVNKMGVNK
ncbi:hypothetical protein TNIN_359791 [Trichonephila inaurata madagascariensis]|uniref:Uncharacterized protein n=1 Tax=Trichonephila inaurata madagascariensis TaxID=2747483 RepID=A0A8X7CAS4_9ARAC|nr:hypothetical protein TNIN_359791 [Trichonephila inaurata madagascariensis]